MYRNTYVEIILDNIKENVKTLVNKYNDYEYYFGVVKADCYGHNDIKSVKAIIDGGCNYLCVATLEEALEIRKYLKDIPVLCFGIISSEYLYECVKNNITITINSLDYLLEVLKYDLNNLKVHIKINSGMNRIGVKTKDEFNNIYNLIKNSSLNLEGIYTHIHSPNKKDVTIKQINVFDKITGDIEKNDIPIIHIAATDTIINYKRLDYINGCRLGIGMYGFVENEDIELLSTFKVVSEVIQINEVENETVGYSGNYKANGKERIAVVSIGYADGIIRKNTGRMVFINDKEYKIVGNICMDLLFVKVDNDVKVHDKVIVLKDIEHIKEVAVYLDTIPYEIICSISKRVPRIYI